MTTQISRFLSWNQSHPNTLELLCSANIQLLVIGFLVQEVDPGGHRGQN